MKRLVFPVLDASPNHTAWVYELARLTHYPLVLIDLTEGVLDDVEDLYRSQLDDFYEEVQVLVSQPEALQIKTDILVLSQHSMKPRFTQAGFGSIPVIILPQEMSFRINHSTHKIKREEKSQQFYKIFKQADKEKLPPDLYYTLGRDKDLFNYLLSAFRNK